MDGTSGDPIACVLSYNLFFSFSFSFFFFHSCNVLAYQITRVYVGSLKLSVTRTLLFTLLPVTVLEKNSPEKGGTCVTGTRNIPGAPRRDISPCVSLKLLRPFWECFFETLPWNSSLVRFFFWIWRWLVFGRTWENYELDRCVIFIGIVLYRDWWKIIKII